MSTFRILRFVERELSIEDYQKLLERKRQDLLTCCRNLPQRATVIQTCGVASERTGNGKAVGGR